MRGMKTAFTLVAGLLGVFSLGSCTEEEPENFGSIRIEVSPLNGDLAMYTGTVEVTATVQYEQCLQDFYLSNNPTYQIDGPDGAAIFEDWQERLCSSEFEKIPDCEVTNITQNLLDVNQVYNLAITYKVTDPSTIAYREFRLGPIPTEAFAACGDSQSPTVELLQSGLIGKDVNGTQLWRISSLPGSNVAVANQGAPLRIETIAINP